MSTPSEVRAWEQKLLNAAKGKTERAENGSFIEEQLTENLAQLIVFDVAAERHRKAARIIRRTKRSGSTEPDGQLMLPGFNTLYDYEPSRMVSDDLGNIIEYHRAPPAFKSAEVRRAEENLDRATEQLRRRSAENRLFQGWALEQALLGRSVLELTWGNCVQEKNLRHHSVRTA